ncbi:MAG: tRNA (guanosine(37)-N1)-methyltransferase TrmD [Nakamurella sp.]
MRIDIITIFPDYLAPLSESLIGKAAADGVIDIAVHNLRDWTTDVHHTVDDAPYGGGPGMVMRPDIWGLALDAVTGSRWTPGRENPDENNTYDDDTYDDVLADGPILVIPTPSGQPFTQAVAEELSAASHLIFACGRYEGIDCRVALDAARRMQVRELSIGDYVLAGGEVAVLVMVEAIGRLLPGVLGNVESAHDDSFADGRAGLLEGPAYTRPADYRGLDVPEVLLSGHHARIERAQRDASLRRTARYRPELIAALRADDLDDRDFDVLTEIGTSPPEGLAERVAAEREAREKKRRHGKRHS